MSQVTSADDAVRDEMSAPGILHRAIRWETGLAVVVIAVGVLGASISSGFFSSGNIFYLGLSSGEIAIMALPMTLIIISGEIDLSVASTLGMSSALLGVLWSDGWPFPSSRIRSLEISSIQFCWLQKNVGRESRTATK